MAELPSGTVTFLFSDIEGSTRLLQRLGERWGDLVATHNRIMREGFAAAGGREVDRQGDAFFAVFPRAQAALEAAAEIQRELASQEWPDGADLLVRMGVHTGEPALGDEGYLGLDVVRAARICSLAQGGQVLVSETTGALVRGGLEGMSLQDVGEHRLKDIDEPERLYQLAGAGLRADLPLPAPVAPGADAVMALAGRETELADQAVARLRELESLGPRIEQQVQDALAQASLAKGSPVAPLSNGRADGFESLRASRGWMAAAGMVAALVVAGALVALAIWLVSLVL